MGSSRRKSGQLPSPEARANAAPAGPRPFALTIPSSREEMVEALRTSLALSTPGIHPSMYREGPPSSAASSCGQVEMLDDIVCDDDGALEPAIDATEWERWIDWDKFGGANQLPEQLDSMQIA